MPRLRPVRRVAVAAAAALAAASCSFEPGPSLDELEATVERDEPFRGIDLRDRTLDGAEFAGANLAGADLRGARLRAATLREARAEGVLLVNADLAEADLHRADLSDAMLQATNLSATDLRGAELGRANLERSDLSGADLTDARLEGAYLWSAILRGANFRGADLRGADLRSVDLTSADFSTATGLTQGQLDYTCSDGGLRLPEGLTPPRACGSGNVPRVETSPKRDGMTVVGKVHCGGLEPCTPQRFLVFTEWGGKIIQVTDADGRATEELERRLSEGVEVRIDGIDPSLIEQHRYFVPAARIVFAD